MTVAIPPARSYRDVWAGLVFILIAALFWWEGTNYELGTLRQMGPGYVPVALAVLLAVLGAGIALAGILRPAPATEPAPVPLRAALVIVVAIVVFGTFINRLGLVPCVFICGTLMALGSARNGIVSAVTIGAALSLMCFLIFKEGLGLVIPTFGPMVTELFDPAAVPPPAPPAGTPAAPVAPVPAAPAAPAAGG